MFSELWMCEGDVCVCVHARGMYFCGSVCMCDGVCMYE